jgi:hypothetical protein
MRVILDWWLLPINLAFGLWLVSASIRAFRNGTLVTAYIALAFAEIMIPISIVDHTPLGRILPIQWQIVITLGFFLLGMATLARGCWVLWHEQKREREEKSASRSVDRLER